MRHTSGAFGSRRARRATVRSAVRDPGSQALHAANLLILPGPRRLALFGQLSNFLYNRLNLIHWVGL